MSGGGRESRSGYKPVFFSSPIDPSDMASNLPPGIKHIMDEDGCKCGGKGECLKAINHWSVKGIIKSHYETCAGSYDPRTEAEMKRSITDYDDYRHLLDFPSPLCSLCNHDHEEESKRHQKVPTKPTKPVYGPAKPTKPAQGPAKPTKPAQGPAKPNKPIQGPAKPNKPIQGPAKPTKPTQGPAKPTKSAQGPAKPTKPAQGPAKPTKPAQGPAKPTKPAQGPAKPNIPAQGPAKPNKPIQGPAKPTKPIQGPAKPTKPTQGPAKPTKSAQGPAKPTKPAQGPAKPNKPIQGPAKPTKPVHGPAKPTQGPAKPTKPTQGPAKPTKPAHGPAKPTKPAEGPAKPTKPAEVPAKPTKPAQGPAKPTKPAQGPAKPCGDEADSASVSLRKAGNKYYIEVGQTQSVVVNLELLHKALTLYEKALSAATLNEEKASAYKNLAMASSKSCFYLAAVKRCMTHVWRQVMNTVDYFSKALQYGNDPSWCRQVETSRKKFSEEMTHLDSFDESETALFGMLMELVRMPPAMAATGFFQVVSIAIASASIEVEECRSVSKTITNIGWIIEQACAKVPDFLFRSEVKSRMMEYHALVNCNQLIIKAEKAVKESLDKVIGEAVTCVDDFERFLRFVYVEFPPENGKWKLPKQASPWNRETMRKALKGARDYYNYKKYPTDKTHVKKKIVYRAIYWFVQAQLEFYKQIPSP